MFTNTKYFNPSFLNTIQEDRTYHGNWWLPDYPQDRVSGVLYLRKTGGIKLHLIGIFLSDCNEEIGFEFANHDIIVGEIVPGHGMVTLISCGEQERKSPYLSNTSEGTTQKFNVENLLMGYHIPTLDNLRFTQFEFSTTYMVDWVNSKQLEIEFIENRQTVVSTLEDKKLTIDDEGYRISINSWASTNISEPFVSKQHSSITIDLEESISLEEFKEVFQKPLLDLIQFGSSLLNSVTFLNAKPLNQNESTELITTNEFDSIKRMQEQAKSHSLFLLSDLENASSFILNWLKFHRDTKHIFKLYFESLHLGFQYPVTKFLNVIQSVEVYHAERSKKNDAYLRDRLKELLSESCDLLSSILMNECCFISGTINTRNYYTHYDSKKKKKAAEGIELLAMTYVLRLLLNFHLLLSCGLDENESKKLIEKNQYFTSVRRLVEENDFWKYGKSDQT